MQAWNLRQSRRITIRAGEVTNLTVRFQEPGAAAQPQQAQPQRPPMGPGPQGPMGPPPQQRPMGPGPMQPGPMGR